MNIMSLQRLLFVGLSVALLTTTITGCPEDEVADEESARQAYLGLDKAVDRAMQLGFDGFAAASNANIPDQHGNGDANGTMVVGGKVDQGTSNNKEMTLDVTLTDYSDGPIPDAGDIIYTGPLVVDLSLKGLPDADLTGSITGTVQMSGHLKGAVTLSLTISGQTEDEGTGKVQRKEGSVSVTGTATSDYGTYTVNVTL